VSLQASTAADLEARSTPALNRDEPLHNHLCTHLQSDLRKGPYELLRRPHRIDPDNPVCRGTQRTQWPAPDPPFRASTASWPPAWAHQCGSGYGGALSKGPSGQEADWEAQYRSSTGQRRTVRPTNSTSRSPDETQLTRRHRAGSYGLEASLGALDAKTNKIDGEGFLLGGGRQCTYYHQYDTPSQPCTKQTC
jgi:hypothetical protein